jgi:predicted Zn-dependent protease
VKLADGWAAFAQSRFDDSMKAADAMLANSPYDPAAKILKARSLLGLQRDDEAVTLLTEQVKSQPSDAGSWMLLAKIYDERNDWPKVLDAERRIAVLAPADRDNGVLMVEAALRSNAIGDARQASFRLLRPDADPELISAVLDRWWNYWPSPQRVADARMLAERASGPERKLLYAAFLNRAGSPGDAFQIASPSATLPVKAENAEANAVMADALSRTGKTAAAKARLDAVIAFDPGNATALRSRAELELRTGNRGASIADAQKLVSVLPQSSSDRLLLAKAYSSSGNSEWAQRTLWSAFQEIPADESIFAALRASRNENADAQNELQAEFARQRSAKLNRGLL